MSFESGADSAGETADRSSTAPFRAGLVPLAALLVAVAVIAVVNNALQAWLLGPDPSYAADELSALPALLVMAAIAWAVLRTEAVRPSDIGLGRPKLRPALAGIAGVVVALNALAAGLVVLGDRQLSVGLFPQYARVLGHTPAVMAVGVVTQYLFVGPVEELVFRGYLQNKLVTLVGGTADRRRAALGVVLTALVFAAVHAPALLLQDGVASGDLIGALVMLTVTALVFGSIYELTGNLYLVAMLHGLGNYWLLVVDPGAWPNWGLVLPVYVSLVVVYRRWLAVPDGADLRAA